MPSLILIAGCNGAGKSTFAPSFLPEGLTSFDYDRMFLENYDSLPDSELRDQFARNKTTSTFEKTVNSAIANNYDFCYETNFDSHPIFWPLKFKENGYQLSMIFFCLKNQDIARHRIQVRTEFKGHFVDNSTINTKWKAGYKNMNLHYHLFDNILFVDNSFQNSIYTNILQIENEHVDIMTDTLPKYFENRMPDIHKYIIKKIEQ